MVKNFYQNLCAYFMILGGLDSADPTDKIGLDWVFHSDPEITVQVERIDLGTYKFLLH